MEIDLVLCKDRNWGEICVRTDNDLLGSAWASNLTRFLCGWSKFVLFLCAAWYCVGIEVGFFFVWESKSTSFQCRDRNRLEYYVRGS